MTNTNPATATRRIKLNEIVTMKDGTSMRIVRIRMKADQICYQDAALPVIDGVPGWMLGCYVVSVARFSALVAPVTQ